MLALLVLLGSALAVPLSVPISPLSPIIVYDPITYSGNEADGWSWTIPKVEWEPPMLGEGAGLNVSRPSAKFAVDFTGTGMFLNGSATTNTTIIRMWDNQELTAKFDPYTFAGSYKVNLDADGHVFGKSMEHSWGLRLANGSLAVDQIVIQTQIDAAYTAGREAPELTQQPVVNNTKKNPMYNWEGDWDWVQEFDPGKFNDKQPHARGKPGARVWWEVPEGVAYLVIGGFVGYEGGTYEVELWPSPGNSSRWAYNASRPFELITQMFVTPLDPKTRYTVGLTNTDEKATLKFRQARYKFTNQDTADAFEALSAQLPTATKRRTSAPSWAAHSHMDLTEEPQVMVPYSETVSQRGSRAHSELGWRSSVTSAPSFDPKGRRIPSPRVQQESDAGTIVVPPSYDPAWANNSTVGHAPPGGLSPASPETPNVSYADRGTSASPVSPSNTDAKLLTSSPDTSGSSAGAEGVSKRLSEKAQYVAELSAAEERQQPPNNAFGDEKKG